MSMEHSYEGRKVLVLGLARSGAAALRLLAEVGADVAGADENVHLEVPGVPGRTAVHLGPFDSGFLDRCDEVIVSPGISPEHPFLQEASSRGVAVTSELELGARFSKAAMIAVTGTNGKSTTVSMIGEILGLSGRPTVVAGNVGVPFCSVVRKLGRDGVFVLEASSFQLETITDFHPAVAGILNMTPDHLDRYPDEESYYSAKVRIVENCRQGDTFFFNAEDSRCVRVAGSFPGSLVPFSSSGPAGGGVCLDAGILYRESGGVRERVMEREELGVVGLHNVENALAAIAAVQGLNIPAEVCGKALAGFRGLAHRMEEVACIEGVTYYNDSKATNIDATLMSLKGLGERVVLIAGGHDKGGDFSRLESILDRVKAVVTIGEAAPLIEDAIGARVPVVRAPAMQEAVELASRAAGAGQLVILSPACASFDMFENFEQRGDVFRDCVRKLAGC